MAMDISLSVGIIAVLSIVNTVFIVVALIKVSKATGEAQKLMELTRMHIAPVAHDVAQITGDIKSITKSVQTQVDSIGVGVDHIRDTARNVKEFELLMQERLEKPLLEITTLISTLLRVGKVFLSRS